MPLTPGLDAALLILGGAAVVAFAIAVVSFSMIPLGGDAPNLSGLVYVVVVPIAALGILLSAAWVFVLHARQKARSPGRVPR